MLKQLPNLLSIFRAFLGLVVPAMLLTQSSVLHYWAAVVFTFAAITDYYDGWLARKLNVTSDTGKWLDPLADKILTLGCLWAFAALGLIPEWCFILVLIREVLVTFCRTGWGLSGVTLGAEMAGKGKLVLQVCWISFCFFYLFRLDGTPFFIESWAATLPTVVLVLAFATVGMTWYSGFSFLFNNRQQFSNPYFAKFVLASGVGLIRFAPGTWGSLAGLVILACFKSSLLLYWAVFFLIAWVAFYYWLRFGGQFEEDPPFFVLDEVCGMFVAMAFVPLTWMNALAGFFLFRFFDIVKPFPVRKFERLPGYWGIMIDDLAAGLYAGIILWLLPF